MKLDSPLYVTQNKLTYSRTKLQLNTDFFQNIHELKQQFFIST